MKTPRIIALLILPSALAAFVLGIYWLVCAAPPYLDPTPELLAIQDAYIQKGTWLSLGGAIVMLADGLWLWRTRGRKT
jgi:hypothetical protein